MTTQLAKMMREHNENIYVSNNGKACPLSGNEFPEVDIRFAEFLDWLKAKDQFLFDVVCLSENLQKAFLIKFDPTKESLKIPANINLLNNVEEIQKRIGVDFLYEPNEQ